MQKKSIKIAKLSTAKQKNIPLEFLPHSLHVIDNAALMNSYLIFFSPQCSMCGPRPYLLHSMQTMLWRQNYKLPCGFFYDAHHYSIWALHKR